MGKSTIFTGQPVFNQLLSFINRADFDQLVKEHSGNRYCKKFTSFDHVVTLLYSSFFQCGSLREITTGMKANLNKLQHVGLSHLPARSTLSDANKNRSERIFAGLYNQLYQTYFGLPDSLTKNTKEDRLYIIDSTTISLFSSIMAGAGTIAKSGKKKGGAKAHVMMDAKHDLPAFILITEAKENDLVAYNALQVPTESTVVFDKAYIKYKEFIAMNQRSITWVTRKKKDAYIHRQAEIDLDDISVESGVRGDCKATLGRPGNQKVTPMVEVRIVTFYDKEKERQFEFMTNDFNKRPEEIAALYKRRWQIELMFKRIKQRYPLKYFLGENVNAIKIQIWSALICDLLVKLVQKIVSQTAKKKWSYANLSSMIKHHLMSYIKLIDFLIDPDKVLKEKHSNQDQLQLFQT